jgi:hypothetical protein
MGVPEHVAVHAALKISGLVRVCLIVEVALKCPHVRCALIFARFICAYRCCTFRYCVLSMRNASVTASR